MWEIKGWIELKASGVQARYALTDTPLPQTPEAIDALAQELFDIGITRESRDLARLEKVVETATAPACTSVDLCLIDRRPVVLLQRLREGAGFASRAPAAGPTSALELERERRAEL